MANKKTVVVVPYSHTWLWLQTCIASLHRNPPVAEGHDVDVVIVDNSPWSPAIKGIRSTRLGNLKNLHIITNYKTNKFHASALDCVVEKFDFDYMMAIETDVIATRPTWLQWFVDQVRVTDFAVGAWHHEKFINPSCTLYRGDALRYMLGWCQRESGPPQDELRWGPKFNEVGPIDNNIAPGDPILSDIKRWIAGPFAEKRGWRAGTVLREQPSGQLKGPGWYEPGQQLHHWAVENDYTYTVCPTMTTYGGPGVPLQTMYGVWGPREIEDMAVSNKVSRCRYACGERGYDPQRQLEANEMFGKAETSHLWGGTRALDILKHEVNDVGIKILTPGWLAREARFWKYIVPLDVQVQTLELIRRHGWHITGQGHSYVTERDKAAAEYVQECYKEGGVEI